MKVYHGSYIKIERVDLSLCRPHRDFGRGFYVTRFRHHAEKWAVNLGRRYKTQPIVSKFEYHDNDFIRYICKIKRFKDYCEEWLDFVVMNRNEDNPEPTHDYDIVEGPVADDKVQNKIDAYLSNEISKKDFLEELKYHEQTHQLCFCTLNSLQALTYLDKTPRRDITDIVENVVKALMFAANMDEQAACDKFFSSDTFALLSDESIGLYKKPWQEIYEMLKCELKT